MRYFFTTISVPSWSWDMPILVQAGVSLSSKLFCRLQPEPIYPCKDLWNWYYLCGSGLNSSVESDSLYIMPPPDTTEVDWTAGARIDVFLDEMALNLLKACLIRLCISLSIG
jgi:hypothetical protein